MAGHARPRPLAAQAVALAACVRGGPPWCQNTAPHCGLTNRRCAAPPQRRLRLFRTLRRSKGRGSAAAPGSGSSDDQRPQRGLLEPQDPCRTRRHGCRGARTAGDIAHSSRTKKNKKDLIRKITNMKRAWRRYAPATGVAFAFIQSSAARWATGRPCVPSMHSRRPPYRFPLPGQRRGPQRLFRSAPCTRRHRHLPPSAGNRHAGVLSMTGRAPMPAPYQASRP